MPAQASRRLPGRHSVLGRLESKRTTDASRVPSRPINMVIWSVKTTLEIPDPVFRRAKARAAERGQALRVFVTEALQEKLSGGSVRPGMDAPPWMSGFGQLRRLRGETARIQRLIDREFDVVEPEDRR